jgi:hypothetical protein
MVAASTGSASTAVAAFLRVYEPLEAFPADERAWWRAVATDGPPSAAEMAAREHAAALRALTALPPRVATDLDLADAVQRPAGIVLQPEAADGRLRICPVELSWRSLLALEEFQTDIVPSVLPAFVPLLVVEAASTALAELVSERSSLTGPHVRSSRWSVPIVWFAAFQPSHRHLGPARQAEVDAEAQVDAAAQAEVGNENAEPDAERPRPSLKRPPAGAATARYLAPMADVRRCLARALASARVAETSLLPLVDLEELGRWLEEFHARSVVELDYSGLGSLAEATDGERDAVDDSVAAVSLGLADLRVGNVDEAITRLTTVRDRWDEIRAHEHAS